MNNPNPFIPQGSLLELQNKKRARMKFAVLAFFGGTILLVGPLLLNGGCRRGDTAQNEGTPSTTDSAPATVVDTNPAPPVPNLATATNGSNVAPVAPVATYIAPPPPPPPAAATASEYVVVKGDTLATIATKNHVKLKDLQAANPTVVPTKLAIGTKLKIPEATMAAGMTASMTEAGGDVYVVKAGDNLTHIATTHGTTVNELKALNGLKTSAIKVGEKLKLPAKSSTASSPMETTPVPSTTTTASNPSSSMPVTR